MKNAVLTVVAIVVIGYCCFVAGQIFSLNEPEETATVESITAVAQDALHNKEYAVAIEEFNRALARNPNDAALHANLGLALKRAGRTQAAIPEFEECLLLDPERIDITKELGKSLYKFERFKEAKKNFEAVVSKRPDDAEAFQWLFTINDRLDHQLDNLPVLERLVELHPDDTQYVYAQVMIYHQNGQNDEALQTFEKLPKAEQETVKARYVLGSIYFKLPDYPKAIELLEQVVENDPEHTEAQELLEVARSQAVRAREYEQEISGIDQAIEGNPEDANLYFQRGLALTKAGNKSQATTAFQKCLSLIDPTDVETAKEIGKKLYSLERFELAEQCLQLIADEANDLEVYELLLGFSSRRNRPLERLPILEKMAALDPDETKYIVWQLGIYLENDKPEEALRMMKKMPQEWQDQVTNQYILGVTYYQLKDFPKAIEVLEKVVSSDPDNADAKKILDLCRAESP